MPPRLGILAGGGDLPVRLAEACRASGREVFVVALEGQGDPERFRDFPHACVRMGAVGTILSRLRKERVEELVMAGSVRRPSLADLRPDMKGAKALARIGLGSLGDDGVLRAVIRELEAEGFRVVGADSLFADLLAPLGPFGSVAPDEAAEADIRRGVTVALGLGRLDVGQGVVVQQGIVLAVETIEGTDAMLDRCGAVRRAGPGGVLVKLKKPQQERRADLPTIGVTTVERAAAAGLRGIAVEAGGSLVLDRAVVARAADAVGLFVIGIDPGQWDVR